MLFHPEVRSRLAFRAAATQKMGRQIDLMILVFTLDRRMSSVITVYKNSTKLNNTEKSKKMILKYCPRCKKIINPIISDGVRIYLHRMTAFGLVKISTKIKKQM